MAPIPTLQPIQASISDFSGMIANRQETLTMKGARRHVTRPSVDVIYQTGDGPGQLLMRCDKKNDGSYTVRSSTNELICTIRKERKVSGGRLRRYFRAYAPGSKDALWELCWEEHHFSRDVFEVKVLSGALKARTLNFQRKVLGQKRGLLLGGVPVATMDKTYPRIRAEHHINVAPGMDIAAVVGMAFCGYVVDKKKKAKRHAVAGSS